MCFISSAIRMPAALAAAVLFSALLGACVPQKPLTPEQQATQQDQQECSAQATSMTDPPYSSSNPYWGSYFEMCMMQRGYTWEQLRKLWY